MRVGFKHAAAPIVVAVVIGAYGLATPRGAFANGNNAINPHSRQDPNQGGQQGCTNVTPEPGWLTLVLAGVAPAAMKLRRRR